MSQDADKNKEQPAAPSTGARLFARRRSLQSPTEALHPETPPPPPGPPPSQRRPMLSAISGFLSFLLLLAVGAFSGLGYLQHQLNAPGPLQSEKVVVIARGTEGSDIIAQLEQEGVVDNALLLNAALVLEGNRSRVRAGEYLFRKNASLREVMDTLVSGKEILHSVTIPEGLTSEQIVQRLRDNELLAGDVRDVPKEGTLLPDTYRVSRGMLRTDLLRKMQDEQKRALEQIWSRRAADLPIRSPYEMLTLASIVEKETGKADERPRVASVFINRLQKRMRLQSDPTIVYGLVGGKGTLGRGILRSEVETRTPYNTYVIEGLPPGPIANPGRAALDAVARPSRTKDIYFVADGSGGHAFAETLDQHNRNVVRWRQLEKEARDRLQAPVDRVQPEAAPPAPGPPPAIGAPRDQRGDLELPQNSVFGSLPVRTATSVPAADDASSNPALAFADPRAPTARPAAARKPATPEAAPAAAARPAPLTGYSLGAQLNEKLVAGFAAAAAAPNSILDGPAEDSDSAVDPTAVPVSAQRRAEQRARAARFGVSAGSDQLAIADDGAEATPAPHAVSRLVKIYDASEGTPLDPLKDKSWDLNSPKTVPAFKPETRLAEKPAPRSGDKAAPQRAVKPAPAKGKPARAE